MVILIYLSDCKPLGKTMEDDLSRTLYGKDKEVYKSRL